MELTKNTINTSGVIAKGNAQAMADGDVIVPDTKPDILKLIQVDCDASITDKYTENGRIVLCGRVDYKVLYVPDQENEKIKSIETSMDFRHVADASNGNDNYQILAKPTVERVEFNTVNSRKLRLRAIVRIDYEAYEMKRIDLSSVCDDDIEMKIDTIVYEDTINISEHEFTIKDRLEIPSGERSVNEILKTDIKIYDTEYKPVTGKVIVKGMMNACVLYTDCEGDIKFTESDIPFTEVFDAENVSDDVVCDIDYCVLCVMATTEPDIDGDLREISLDIDVSASMKATRVSESQILTDCFVPYTNTKCNTEKISLKNTIERPFLTNTIRDVIVIDANAPRVNEIYNIMTNAQILKSQLERNKIICEGKIEVYILYLTDSNENPVYSLKKDIPFSYMIDCKSDTDGLECEMKTLVKHSSYNLNSSGEIEIRCLLSIECMLIENYEIENITDIVTEPNRKRQGMVIYFARTGESLWDIAKRYGVPCESLESQNEIETEILKEDRKLFIPIK